MSKTIKLTDEVREVLSRCEITESTLRLPDQLDRKLYVAVDKVIKAAGGKWNRGKGVHVFADDPRKALGLAVESGTIENEQQVKQTFYTPPELADELVEAACVTESSRVLEPSAGKGAIVEALLRAGVTKLVVFESDPKGADALIEIERANRSTVEMYVWEDDFLSLPASGTSVSSFDAVVMNPPFSEGQEVRHVMHAWQFVKPGGRLVSVMSKAITFRKDGAYAEFTDFLRLLDGSVELRSNGHGAFKSAGTNVDTITLILTKS